MELNRFRKELRDCGTFVEQWCYALKRVGTLDSQFDRDTKLIYEKDMITERDYQNIIDTAAEDGRAVVLEFQGQSEEVFF